MAGDGADGSELELSDAGAEIGARDGETRTAAAEDDEDGGDDFGGGPLRRLAGGGGEASDEGARASEGTAHRPQREAEVWLEEGGRRMPSLAASSEAEAERAAKRVVVLRLDVERQRLMQKGLDEAAGEGHDDVWPQGWRRELPAKLADDPVVRVLRRAPNAESAWTPGAQGRRALFRGLSAAQLDDVRGGGGLQAEQHRGGIAQHARDINSGSRAATRGLSLTKDPYIAARYAAADANGGGGGGGVVCVDAEAAAASGEGHDFSGDAGEAQLREHGANDRTVRFARADAEWRQDGPMPAEWLRRSRDGELLVLDAETAAAGDRSTAKAAYGASMQPTARDAVAEFAARCEGWASTARAESGAAVRMDWDEARDVTLFVDCSVPCDQATGAA